MHVDTMPVHRQALLECFHYHHKTGTGEVSLSETSIEVILLLQLVTRYIYTLQFIRIIRYIVSRGKLILIFLP
jgi:hypothetical protein